MVATIDNMAVAGIDNTNSSIHKGEELMVIITINTGILGIENCATDNDQIILMIICI